MVILYFYESGGREVFVVTRSICQYVGIVPELFVGTRVGTVCMGVRSTRRDTGA